ncbi:thiolase [Neoconidiobolus thromboides FSU 785]|nr:thiolase [Neoconidiobolus thromboides FSU 785]
MSPLSRVFIASAARTPVGSFKGVLSNLSAVQLGVHAAKGAINKAGIEAKEVDEVYMGNVLQAGLGQAPARQVALGAGCKENTPSTTINKVCASGMKAVILATQNIQTGTQNVMLAGGMESMSNSPFYSPRNVGYGHQQLLDSIVKDGLTDAYDHIHMGVCSEETAVNYNITREQQDQYAIKSYEKAAEAWKNKVFKEEVIPIEIVNRKKASVVDVDEEFTKVKFDKIASLKSVFKKDGTITAANASKINDGASALVLVSESKANELNIKPLAEIISYADAACIPKNFTIAPSFAVPIALQRANLKIEDISLFEFNEAFSLVNLVNEKLLKLDPSKCNIAGGAVSLGHPIGSSGSRILVTLTHLLQPGQYGCAAICNGGGGASAIIIKKL